MSPVRAVYPCPAPRIAEQLLQLPVATPAPDPGVEDVVRRLGQREERDEDGLSIAPQLGLVPLGMDEVSGPWEFWHVATGREPHRDERTGHFVVAEGDGLVLVLIPGGATVMGGQTTDRHAPRYDPQARKPMEVQHEVELAPFFLSKYELTQDDVRNGAAPRAIAESIGLRPARALED
jgi:hypothetical protein